MHIHNGTWPFKCDICSKGFTKQTNLKNHILIHTGKFRVEKKFEKKVKYFN